MAIANGAARGGEARLRVAEGEGRPAGGEAGIRGSSRDGHAAVDDQRLAGDEPAGRRGQEHGAPAISSGSPIRRSGAASVVEASISGSSTGPGRNRCGSAPGTGSSPGTWPGRISTRSCCARAGGRRPWRRCRRRSPATPSARRWTRRSRSPRPAARPCRGRPSGSAQVRQDVVLQNFTELRVRDAGQRPVIRVCWRRCRPARPPARAGPRSHRTRFLSSPSRRCSPGSPRRGPGRGRPRSRPPPRRRPRACATRSPTRAPCSAIRRAIARPMPRDEPVISATLPVRSNRDMGRLCSGRGGTRPPPSFRGYDARTSSTRRSPVEDTRLSLPLRGGGWPLRQPGVGRGGTRPPD